MIRWLISTLANGKESTMITYSGYPRPLYTVYNPYSYTSDEFVVGNNGTTWSTADYTYDVYGRELEEQTVNYDGSYDVWQYDPFNGPYPVS
jgi:hypothetical protein